MRGDRGFAIAVAEAGLVLALVAGAILTTAWSARAQTPTTLEFLVPVGTDITTGVDGDMIIFVARSTGPVTVGDCADGSHESQTAMAVDPGSGTRASRITGIIATSQTDRVPNGTKVKNLVFVSKCDTQTYDKYRGDVE